MTVPSSTPPRSPAPARAPNGGKPWVTPTLARINTSDAENSANPSGTDGILSMGS